jgi:transposase InsO family protein
VVHVRQVLSVSERRACRVLGESRRMQRYQARVRDDEGRLTPAMLELVRQHPRYGYRRIWALLRQTGWHINRKRVHRLWKQNGLKVPSKAHKCRRLGNSGNGCIRHRAEHPNHVWAWDFIFDRTNNGRSIKWLSVIDEYTRECLALEVARSMGADEVVEVLVELSRVRGMPKHIRSDNGPEFIATAIRRWLEAARIGALYI